MLSNTTTHCCLDAAKYIIGLPPLEEDYHERTIWLDASHYPLHDKALPHAVLTVLEANGGECDYWTFSGSNTIALEYHATGLQQKLLKGHDGPLDFGAYAYADVRYKRDPRYIQPGIPHTP